MFTFIQSFIFTCLLLAVLSLWKRKTSAMPLPPGPRRWPIIGNALDMPKEKPWLTFSEWRKTYGDIASLSALGRTIIVLNSDKAVVDLFDKRSAHYSDKPHLPMGGEMVGWDQTLALIPNGERFREMRRLFLQVLGSRPSQAFWPTEEQETACFLGHLLATPEDFAAHIRHTAGAIILKISHGYTVSDGQDEVVDLAEKVLEQFSQSTDSGAFLVDMLPWLKHVPAWFPGARFKRIAAEYRDNLFRMVDVAHEFTKDEMKRGRALPSFTSEHLANSQTPEFESMIKWTAFSMLAGGADTTVSAMKTFFLAMCTHPAVQVAAQAELDAVLGSERLPTMADRQSLPYIQAILKEVLRWGPVIPMRLVKKMSMKVTDFLKTLSSWSIPGNFGIPGINVLVHTKARRGMLHDPEVFPEPGEFRPERFTRSNQVDGLLGDPLRLAFGLGRRACPGRYLAEHSIYLSIAMTLATFTISKVRDGSGMIIEPEVAWLSRSISHPKPFRCEIKPRSARAVELINQAIEAGRV